MSEFLLGDVIMVPAVVVGRRYVSVEEDSGIIYRIKILNDGE